jgi:23S rRNA (uracil1939-C5)-methyltransferase
VGRKKKLPLLENLEIVDIAAEGRSMARIDNMVVFVPGLVPGDIADVQINRKRKNFMEGFVVALKKPSNLRVDPVCRHFGVCGGCKWQHLPYEKQVFYKQKQVEDNLQRIGKVNLPKINTIVGSKKQFEYRNKLEYTFSASRWLSEEEVQSHLEITDRRALGFHIPGKFDRVMDIEKCHLQHDLSNRIRNNVKEYTLRKDYSFYHQRNNTGFMRNLIVRNTSLDEWMVVVVFHFNEEPLILQLMEHLKSNFPELTSLMYVVNPKVNDTIHDLSTELYSGRDHIFEELNGLKFKIGPKSFFQTNSMQALELYRIAKEFADLNGEEVVYDLYTGTGTIAIYLANSCTKVIGIESVESAIADAKINSELNGIENTLFFAGDVGKVLNERFIKENGCPDVIVTDPPRAGMHTHVVDAILKSEPQKIVYVSCNPATQARDIQLLSEKYRLTKIQPVDMFPHTHHVENVARLDLII